MITKVMPDYLRTYLLNDKAKDNPAIAEKATLFQGAIVAHYKYNGKRYVIDLVIKSETQPILKEMLNLWAEEDHEVMITLVMNDL